MAISNFELRPETADPAEQELWLAAGASIDYETPADRKQRGIIRADRAESSSVTAKTIRRGFTLDVTNVNETPAWIQALPTVTLQVAPNLAAQSQTLDLSSYARDDEGDFFEFTLGTVPSQITAAFGTGQDVNELTVTYPTQTVNPASNLNLSLPLYLSQPVGTKVPGSDRTLAVRVNRYAPRAIYSTYPSPTSQGRLYIDSHQAFFAVFLDDFVQNHDNRPLVFGHTAAYQQSWDTALANFTISTVGGRPRLVGTRPIPFSFNTVQTANVVIHVRTDDVGDRSEAFIHFLLRVEPPPVGG